MTSLGESECDAEGGLVWVIREKRPWDEKKYLEKQLQQKLSINISKY